MPRRRTAIELYGHHLPVPDDDTPGCCRLCPIPLDRPHDIHTLPDRPAAAREAEAARLGEREEDL